MKFYVFSKTRLVTSIMVVGIMILSMLPLTSYAANRDFHFKDGSKTFYASEWRNNVEKFLELIVAIAINSDNLAYEFQGKYYDYNGLSTRLDNIPADRIEETFIRALEDERLMVQINQNGSTKDDFAVEDIY